MITERIDTLVVGGGQAGLAMSKALAERSIMVDHRPDAGIRVSPHFYTREDELVRFAEVMTELRETKAWKNHLQSVGAY